VATAIDETAPRPDPSFSRGSTLTTFVGREQELAQLRAMLDDPAVRLVTLTGPGGVGKTRLAQEMIAASPDFASDVLFLELASVSDPELVPSLILRAVGGEAAEDMSALDSLIAHLNERRLLLVLDNVEQLLNCAADVQAILTQCPQMKVLATSRTPLRIRGEYEVAVDPLPLERSAPNVPSAAEQLLSDRVRAVRPSLGREGIDEVLARQICQRLDCLPLAIELAAAQLRLMTPEALADRLGLQLDVLARGPRDLPDRQQTMRATVAWSYQLLPEPLREAFATLSVFSGGFSFATAAGLLGESTAVQPADIIDQLVTQSLVRMAPGHDQEQRFQMLETIRAFGLDMLTRVRRLDSMLERHACYFRDRAELTGPMLRTNSAEQERIWNQLDSDLDNLRAAIAWFVTHDRPIDAVRLVSGLDWFWTDSNLAAEGLRLLDELVPVSPLDDHPLIKARALRVHATLADLLGRPDVLADMIEQAIAACRALNDDERLPELLHLSSGALIDQDRLAAARVSARETIDISRAQGNLWFEGAGELNLALIETLSGDYDAAIRASQRAAVAYQANGNVDLQQNAMLSQALAWLLAGDYQRSQETYQAILLQQLERSEDSYYFQSVVRGMASIATRTGQYELSARISGMANAELERTGITTRKPLRQALDAIAAEAERMIGGETYRLCLEAGHVLDRLDALNELLSLAAPPAPVDRKARPTPFNLLSNREFEVLLHLRTGKTDPEIAAELYLSPRTVSQHVSAILGKLQVSGRSAAAALAASANVR